MSTKSHYNDHLSKFYAWMVGDFNQQVKSFHEFLLSQEMIHGYHKTALDLGSGHGIQSVALAKAGYDVTAVDFCEPLLTSLSKYKKELTIDTVEHDMLEYVLLNPKVHDLIICWGDTLTHLEDKLQLNIFLRTCCQSLESDGRLLLSFRDYSKAFIDESISIPVKETSDRKLTCHLHYEEFRVKVRDEFSFLHQDQWHTKTSEYFKIRINPNDVVKKLRDHGLRILHIETVQGMVQIIAHNP